MQGMENSEKAHKLNLLLRCVIFLLSILKMLVYGCQLCGELNEHFADLWWRQRLLLLFRYEVGGCGVSLEGLCWFRKNASETSTDRDYLVNICYVKKRQCSKGGGDSCFVASGNIYSKESQFWRG